MKVTARLFVVLGVLSVAMVAAASAYACNPGVQHNVFDGYQDGWWDGPFSGDSCLDGSEASILIKDPYSLTGVAGWTMILWRGTSNRFAQIGYGKLPNESDVGFWEYDTPGTGDIQKWPITNAPNPTLDTYVDYKVTFTGGAFHFFVNGTVLFSVAVTYGGCAAAQAGETHSLADQMPGSVSHHEIYSSPQVRDPNLGWSPTPFWQTFVVDLTTGADASQYFGSYESPPGQALDTWDKRCT